MSIATESQIQKAFFTWIKAQAQHDPRLKWCYAVPNEARRSYKLAQHMISMGLRAGVADVCLPCSNGINNALYLEFKTDKGKQTETQRAFQQYCQAHNNQYTIVRSVEQAILTVQSYLQIAPK